MHVLATRVKLKLLQVLRMLMACVQLAVIHRGAKKRIMASLFFVGAKQCLVLVIHYCGIEDTPVAMMFKPAVRIWTIGTGVIIPHSE